jgi:F0F1-type ATP synthase gamma subunit
MVPITGDKGLCGACNSQIIRELKKTIGPNRAEHKIFVLGEKGNAALRRPYPDILFAGISYIGLPINFMAAASIAHKIEAAADDCDEMVIMYNEFKNVVTNFIRQVPLMTR